MLQAPRPLRASRWHIWRAARTVLGAFAPPCCALCGGSGQWFDEPAGLDLCIHCEQACPRWQSEPLPFDAVFCLFRYTHPVDQMITRLKFHGDLAFARVLGTLFARAWNDSGNARPDCIVPLPLHRSRHRERGFCQTTEIARHLAPRLRDPHGSPMPIRTDLLSRVAATPAQSGLSAEKRAQNMRNAFQATARHHPPPHVALLDDVLTTGHTALAAAAALRAAGVETVQLWCCARAVRENAAPPWPAPTTSPSPPPAAGGFTTS